MELTDAERIIMINQMYILSKLYPEKEEDFENQRIALEYGFEHHYDDLYPNINEEKLNEEECFFVIHVLQMYDMINMSFEKIRGVIGLTLNDIKFKGFEGTTETKYMQYTRYCIENLDQYQSIKENHKQDYNNHKPMINYYKKKLIKFNEINFEEHSNLNFKQIKSLI